MVHKTPEICAYLWINAEKREARENHEGDAVSENRPE